MLQEEQHCQYVRQTPSQMAELQIALRFLICIVVILQYLYTKDTNVYLCYQWSLQVPMFIKDKL